MKYRPWSLIILAAFHVFAPIGNIIANSFLFHVSLGTYIQAILTPDQLDKTLVFLLVPIIGGVLIYICKKWSYYLYLALMSATFIYGYFFWKRYQLSGSALYILAIYTINIIIVIYFMLPQVKQVYFDSRLRWWETKPRFSTDFSADVVFNEQKSKANIKNVSEGGLFIETELVIENHSHVDIHFEYQNKLYQLKGETVYCKAIGEVKGYGLRLMSRGDKVKEYKELLDKLNVEGMLVPSRVPTTEDTFSFWFKRLVRERKGWVPEKFNGSK